MNVLCVSPSKYICSYVGYTSPSHHFMDLQQTIISWCQVYAFLGVKCNSDWMLCPPPDRPTDRHPPHRAKLILSLSCPPFYLFPLISSPILSSLLPSCLLSFPLIFQPWFGPSPSSFICIQSIFSPAWWLLDEASFWLDTVMKTEILFPERPLWVFSTIQCCSRVIDAVVVVLVSQFAFIDVSARP